jgi:hypothetical protein
MLKELAQRRPGRPAGAAKRAGRLWNCNVERGLLQRTIETGFETGGQRCRLLRSGNNLTSGEPPNMSIEAHLAELERRHRALEAELNEARAHPSIDDLQIVELKRRKLLVKDEIARLQLGSSVH